MRTALTALVLVGAVTAIGLAQQLTVEEKDGQKYVRETIMKQAIPATSRDVYLNHPAVKAQIDVLDRQIAVLQTRLDALKARRAALATVEPQVRPPAKVPDVGTVIR